MLRQLIRDSLIYGSGSILVRGVSFFLIPIYTRLLLPSDYGAIELVGVFASLIAVAVALEITQGLARYLPDSHSEDERAGYASSALWFTVVMYTAFLAVAVPAAPLLSEIVLQDPAGAPVFQVALVAMWGTGVFYVLQNQLRFDLRPLHYTLASVMYAVVSAVASVLLIAVARAGLAGVFWGQVVGGVAGIGVGMYFTRHNFRWSFDAKRCLAMLRFSLPLVPSSLAVIVTLTVDRIAISQLMSISDVGLFSVGYRLASVASLAMVGFQVALTPLIYARYAHPETRADLARIFRLFAAAAMLLCLALGLFAREALVVMTTPQYYEGAVVVPLLAPAVLFNSAYVFAPGLSIAKRTAGIAIINVVGAVANTVLNFALIPLFGIRGAALGTLLSSALVFGSYMVTSQRAYAVPHRWRPLALGALVTGVLLALGSQLQLEAWPLIALKVGIFATAVAAIVALGLVQVSEMRRTWVLVRGLL